MTTVAKLEKAWKHRRFLWKYRKLIRHRGAIAAALLAGVAAVAVVRLASGPALSGQRREN